MFTNYRKCCEQKSPHYSEIHMSLKVLQCQPVLYEINSQHLFHFALAYEKKLLTFIAEQPKSTP